jgi:hypothetical protein
MDRLGEKISTVRTSRKVKYATKSVMPQKAGWALRFSGKSTTQAGKMVAITLPPHTLPCFLQRTRKLGESPL